MVSASAPSRYIPTLDGWRCIAICFVLFAHASTWLGIGTTKLARLLHYPGIGMHIERAGMTGVGVFFCISGFLITRRLIEQRSTLQNFYARRAFRILPAALVYLSCIALLGGVGAIAVGKNEMLAALFFYRNYLDKSAWFTGHFWSLSIEEQFYLIWPTILAAAGVRRSRVLAVIGICAVVIWRQMHWPISSFAYFHTDMRLDAILCGSAMALFWPTFQAAMRKTSSIFLFAGVSCFILTDLWSKELEGFTDSLQALLVCLLIAGTVVFPRRLASRILEWRVVAWVGRLSYSLYLWQQLLLRPINSPHWQLPLRLAGILGLAWLSYRFVERPLIAMGRRLLEAHRAEPQLAVV